MPARRSEKEKIVEEYAKDLRNAGSWIDQERYLNLLAGTRRSTAIPHIVRILTRPRDAGQGQQQAAVSLVEMGEVALDTIRQLVNNPGPTVRENMAYALGNRSWGPKIESKVAVPLLLELAKDRNWGVRRTAISSLGEHADLKTLPLIMSKTRKKEHAEVRPIAVRALGSFHHPRIIQILNRALAEPDPFMRQCAVNALTRIRGAPTLPGLAKALEDEDEKTWQQATATLKAIAELPTEDENETGIRKTLLIVHPYLRENEEDGVVRQAYVAALKGKISKSNARLYVKQLRAMQGSLK